tara:strand:+ start:2340 stop:2855 length:516 start_codon:yes stop_codon:yes gene_type:complete
MKISKHVLSKIERDYFFIKGNTTLDLNYFINEIEKGINQENNKNFKTNVKGMMTDWKYFCNDKRLMQFIMTLTSYLDNEKIFHKTYYLGEAWGLKETFGGRTTLHDHSKALWSGVLYLSNIDQPLVFPEINEEIEVRTGNFAIFSSFLSHKTKNTILDESVKYGISFNFFE